jgi:hypothetical protein
MSFLISSIPLMRHGFPPLCITPSLRSVYYDALNIVSVFYGFIFLLSRTVNLLDSGVSHFLCAVLLYFFYFVLPSLPSYLYPH